MIIRKIKPEDNAAVAGIIRTVMTEIGAVGRGYSIEDPEVDAMFEAYDQPRSVFYVLEDQNELVGCGGLAQLVGAESTQCELQKMYFLPAARGQGLGKILGEMLIVDARRFEYCSIYIETLETLTVSNRLYQKLGFELLEAPEGNTGHCGCDTFYRLSIEPLQIDPSLLA